MAENTAFMSGKATFSPNMKELIKQAIETMKLDIVQGIAYETEPRVFRAQGIRKNPSKLGKIVAQRIKSLPSDTKRDRPDYSAGVPLRRLYDSSIRDIARKHNVDLMLKTPITKQIDAARNFAFIAEDLASEKKIATLHDNLFDTEIDSESARLDARAAITTAIPALAIDPSVARIFAERTRRLESIDWSKVFGAIDDSDDGDSNGDNEPPPIQLNRGLRFRLHKVKCVDETNPEWPGDDEIAAGGVAVNWDEATTKINEFRVGNSFDDGEVKQYSPPRVLQTFSLDGASYPADFLVMMALAEKDSGGMSSFIDELWKAIKDEVQLILTAVGAAAGLAIGSGIGGTVGTAIGGPLGAIIGVAAGAILGALIGWLISALKDDIFEPQSAALRLPTQDSTFAGGSLVSPIMSLNFEDHGGYYRAYYSWEITR
jgi:hypothetical protein